MIVKIENTNYYKILKVLNSKKDNVEVKAILSNFSPGTVFVDNEKNPKNALIYSNGLEGFFIIGNSVDFARNIQTSLSTDICNFLKEQKLNYFEVSAENEAVLFALKRLLYQNSINMSKQYVFKYKAANLPNSLFKLNDEFEIRMILFDSNKPVNLKILEERIESFWISKELFQKNGYGYYVIIKNQVVSFCIAAYVTDTHVAFDIETLQKYRKEGLAIIVAYNCIAEALNRNLIPYWDCMDSNIASQKTALSVGFEKQYEYNLLKIEF